MFIRRLISLIFTAVLVGTTLSAQTLPFKNPDLPEETRAKDALRRLTVDERISLLRATSPAIDHLGISRYYHGNEALHGVVRPGKFTVFPQAIGLAATWNPDLIHSIATAISDEARGRWNELEQGKLLNDTHSDLLSFWSPTINMARDPRWGRTPETYGEDPFLTGEIGLAFVRGLQGDDERYIKCVSTPKHFAVNNEEHNRGWNNVIVPVRDLHNYYFPAFKKCVVEGKAQSIMSAYNGINGYPCSINKWLLTDVLRDDWGFDGYVVSDCSAPEYVVYLHHFTDSYSEAAALCLKAGLDLECGDNIYVGPMKDALNEGKISVSDINEAALRILRGRLRLGLFDAPADNPYNSISPTVVGCPAHQQLAAETARQSLVLIKNDSTLPLDLNAVKSIGVVGINAAKYEYGDYSGSPLNTPLSVLDGIKLLAPDVKVNYTPWSSSSSFYTLVGPTVIPAGAKVEYFSNPDLSGTPVVFQDTYIYYDPKNQPPNPDIASSPMSIRWTAEFVSPVSGRLQFEIKSDDGCRFYIDDQIKINEWVVRAETTNYTTIMAEKGRKYRIVLEYFDNGGEALARLSWRSLASTTSIAPIDKFGDVRHVLEASDVIIAVMGIDRSIEREGQDRESLDLPADQIEFIREAAKINPNIVVVMIAGSPLAMNSINADAKGILYAWYPGEQGGRAVAEALFGMYNPGGRLPLTFHRSIADLPPFDDYDITHGRTYMYFDGQVEYPFGYGLSYTRFDYANITAEAEDEQVLLSFDITNSGGMDGDEVAQVYFQSPDNSLIAPKQKLCGFKRVNIKAGQKNRITIPVKLNELKEWDESTEQWKFHEGDYVFRVGASSADIRLQTFISLPAKGGVSETIVDHTTTVKAITGGVEITTIKNSHVNIFNLSGAQIVNENIQAGTAQYLLSQGIYIINVNGNTHKVIVSK